MRQLTVINKFDNQYSKKLRKFLKAHYKSTICDIEKYHNNLNFVLHVFMLNNSLVNSIYNKYNIKNNLLEYQINKTFLIDKINGLIFNNTQYLVNFLDIYLFDTSCIFLSIGFDNRCISVDYFLESLIEWKENMRFFIIGCMHILLFLETVLNTIILSFINIIQQVNL